MGVLTEFVRSEAAHLRGEIGKRDVELSNWKTAIQRLNEMLKDWVVEADSGHNLLATSPTIEYTRQEATFSTCLAPPTPSHAANWRS